MWIWVRRAAFLALIGALIFAAFAFYLWVMKAPFLAVAMGQPVADGFDVVAFQLDVLTLAVTAVGIGLAVAAIFGYQALKDAAQATAKRTAKQVADKVATEAIAEHIEKLQTLMSSLGPHQQPTPPPPLGQVEEVKKEEVGDVGTAARPRSNKKAPAKRSRTDN
jgi:hypothetical protein